MPINIRFDDITTYEVDAIVNSLGVDGSVFGRLCESILTKANNKNLTDFISSSRRSVGTILVTDSYDLPCKNIIHIVTPFKKEDDENNTNLIRAYEKILDKAIENGYKSIALPFIGAGANGYDENDAYGAIMEACSKILIEEEKLDKDIIDIYVVGYLKAKPIRRRNEEEFRYRQMEFVDYNCCKVPVEKGRTIFNKIKNYVSAMDDFDENEMIMPLSSKYTYPYDFIDDFINVKNIDEKVITKNCYDRRRKHQLRNAKSLKKIDIYRLAFVLGMNKTELFQFMIVCGVWFSPLDAIDKFFLNYMNGKYGKARDLLELTYFAGNREDMMFVMAEK